MSGLKRRIFVGVGILLICLSAFFIFRYFFGKTQRSSWEAVSEESLLLLRLDDPVAFWNELVSRGFWREWSTIAAVRNAESMLIGLDSLSGQQGRLQKYLKDKNMIVSLQPVGKDAVDWLFVLESDDETLLDFWSSLESSFPKRYTTDRRLYSDVEILEVKGNDPGRVFAIARIENLVLLSFTSFLIEEAIRNLQSQSIANLSDIYGEFLSAENEPVTLVLTKAGLSGFAELLGKSDGGMVLNGWPKSLAAKIYPKFEGSDIQFAGELFSDPRIPSEESALSEKTWINWFNMVAEDAASYSIGNQNEIRRFSPENPDNPVLNQVVLGEIERKLIGKGFLSGFSGKGLEMDLGQSFTDRQDRILVFQTDSAARQIALLRDFVIDISNGLDRSTFVDFYKGREIFLIDLDQFPTHLFQAHVPGFPNTFAAFLDGYMVMANSSGVLKRYLDDIGDGSQEVLAQDFLVKEPDLSRAQILWQLDFSKAWLTWVKFMGPSWAAFFQKYSATVLQFEKISLMILPSESFHLLTGRVTFRNVGDEADEQLQTQENRTISFPEPLVFGPKALRNFNDASLEFLVQDRLDRVYLITEEGEEIFNSVIDGPIVSEVFQIDYYRNNKLQLLFATANSLYAVDRLGGFLPGFPVNISKGAISHLNLVDYENDRNYRYFIGSESGEVYLLDRDGNLLDGWNPKIIPEALASPPAHYRVPGMGDRMFVLDQKGNWYVFNRRGEPEPGAPFKLSEEVLTQYAIREGNSAKETRIVTVSPKGEVVMANFRGEIIDRVQLPRPDRESSFHLVKDPNHQKYLLIIQEFNQWTVLDESFQTLFSQRMEAGNLAFQYFNFGEGKDILVVIDSEQEFVFLYGLDGKMLLEQPFSGTLPLEITLPPGKNEYAIFSIFGNRWAEYRLPL